MSLIVLPRQILVDANGNPRVGAKMNVYAAGTTTPIATYTTAAYAVANTNPLISAASGFFGAAYVNPAVNATYKLVVTDSADVSIWTEDNIPAAFNTVADLAALSVSSAVLSSLDRTAAEISAGVTPVNYSYAPGDIRRYGTNATPGTTDMASAITNALAANDVVDLQGESYLISSAIAVASNKTLRGKGSNKTFINTNANTINALELAEDGRRIFLECFALVAPSVGASNAGIAMDPDVGVGQSEFKDLQINNFFTGIFWDEQFWESSVVNVRCNSCARGAFTAGTGGQSINVKWRRFYSEGHTVVGMQLSAVKTYVLDTCNFGGEQGGGQSQALYVTTNSHVSIKGGTNFESHVVAANDGVVEIDSGSSVEMDGVTFAINAGASATGYNLVVDGTAVVHLRNVIEVSNGSNLSSVRLLGTAQLVKHDDLIPASGIAHAAGSTATTVVRSPYQSRQVFSEELDLSGAAAQALLYVPKRAGRITRLAAIYPEGTSADAGAAVVVRTDDSVLTYANFISHTSQSAWDVQNITLGATEIDSSRPIIVAMAGGKTGAGTVIIVLEYSED